MAGRQSPIGPRCPVDHAVETRADGGVRISSFAAADQLMRTRGALRQAGFNAELVDQLPPSIRPPVLHTEGKQHQSIRTTTAKFFTPKATERYRGLMGGFADEIVSEFQARRRGDLSLMGRRMAAQVIRHVLGLTESDVAGFEERFDAAITRDPETGRRLRARMQKLRRQAKLLTLYMRDIRPAVKRRRNTPQADLLSHLLELGYSPIELLIECLMYGVAGMLTTREFICVCMVHLDADPELRRRYLTGAEEQRRALLYEILRVEPIVGTLHRRTTKTVQLETDDGTVDVPEGTHVELDVYAINADEAVVGGRPEEVCPGRSLGAQRQPLYSFGAGPHRCPGEWLAIQETDILLHKLDEVEGLEVLEGPQWGHNPAIEGYELREFILGCA